MNTWNDCIVSYIDLIDIKKDLEGPTSDGINKMRQMHRITYEIANRSMSRHERIYYWNDSVLLLALPKTTDEYEPIIREVNTLKKMIDKICKTYAICMKGQTIPGVEINGNNLQKKEESSKAIYIRASSLAFSNCFEVVEILGKRNIRSPWYIDERIVAHISTIQSFSTRKVTLFPRKVIRKIFLFDGYLWD